MPTEGYIERAFPVPMIPCDRDGGHTEVRFQGMTLRDWFAGQAVIGLLSEGHEFERYADMAHDAYMIADAMLEHRNH